MLPDCDNSGAHRISMWPFGTTDRIVQGSAAAAEYLNLEVADLLAQRIAVDPEQIGSANLVAAGGRERHRQQRMLDLPQDAVIQTGRRQLVAETRKIGDERSEEHTSELQS